MSTAVNYPQSESEPENTISNFMGGNGAYDDVIFHHWWTRPKFMTCERKKTGYAYGQKVVWQGACPTLKGKRKVTRVHPLCLVSPCGSECGLVGWLYSSMSASSHFLLNQGLSDPHTSSRFSKDRKSGVQSPRWPSHWLLFKLPLIATSDPKKKTPLFSKTYQLNVCVKLKTSWTAETFNRGLLSFLKPHARQRYPLTPATII